MAQLHGALGEHMLCAAPHHGVRARQGAGQHRSVGKRSEVAGPAVLGCRTPAAASEPEKPLWVHPLSLLTVSVNTHIGNKNKKELIGMLQPTF